MQPHRPHRFFGLVLCVIASGGVALIACDGPGGRGGQTTVLATCNNGALDPGEICDGTLVGVQTCQSAGYARGVLLCNRACTNFDYSGCSGGADPGSDVVDDTSGSGDTVGTVDTASPSETTSGPNRPPTFLSLNANTTTLNVGATLIVTAVLTDPDGIDDLIGGNLVDVTTGGSYGAFATSAAEGSYTITIDWGALVTVNALDAPATGGPLGLRAEFYDVAGAKSERALTITVRCDATLSDAICDGECNALTDASSCGACGYTCEDHVPASVTLDRASSYTIVDCTQDRRCWFLTLTTEAIAAGQSCREVCASKGLGCSGNGVRLASPEGEDFITCDARYNNPSGSVIRASCGCDTSAPQVVTPTPTTVTIASLQTSAASVDCTAAGDQPHGGEITIEGVVTVGRFKINTTLSGMFVSDGTQNPSSAILVRFPTTETWSFGPGRRVRVTGRHYEYYCMTQLAATAMSDIGSGSVPAPRAIAKNLSASELEPWEGVVVQLGNVTVTSQTPQYGEVDTNAGVMIDDFILGSAFVLPPVDTSYTTVRGALVFGFERYRVAPRNDDDY